jgi:hypothetical protein
LVINVSRDPAENTSTSPLGLDADDDVVLLRVDAAGVDDVFDELPHPAVSSATPASVAPSPTRTARTYDRLQEFFFMERESICI